MWKIPPAGRRSCRRASADPITTSRKMEDVSSGTASDFCGPSKTIIRMRQRASEEHLHRRRATGRASEAGISCDAARLSAALTRRRLPAGRELQPCPRAPAPFLPPDKFPPVSAFSGGSGAAPPRTSPPRVALLHCEGTARTIRRQTIHSWLVKSRTGQRASSRLADMFDGKFVGITVALSELHFFFSSR